MDLLSEVLLMLEPQTFNCGGMDLGAGASLHLPAYEGLKCYAVASGECWLQVEELSGTVHLREGKCLLLPRGLSFRLRGFNRTKHAPQIQAQPVQCGTIATYGEGGQCCLVGAHFLFSTSQAAIFLRMMPPIVHLQNAAENVPLCSTLQSMSDELARPRPGGVVIAHALARMMLVQALRVHIDSGGRSAQGCLAALSDPRIASSLALMHGEPGKAWSVEALATKVGMSRASFAARFVTLTAQPPMAYLTAWRIALAEKKLIRGDATVEQIAQSLGYASVSAFGRVFAKATGKTPKEYRKQSSLSTSGDGVSSRLHQTLHEQSDQ